MDLLAVISLLATVAGAVKDVADILNDLQSLGLKPGDPLPAEHVAKIKAALNKVPLDVNNNWDADHAGEGS